MKSIIKETEFSYPCLMQSESLEFVVLFLRDSEGIVVSDEHEIHGIGYYGKHWKQDRFEIFKDNITLENS